jgi:hypothetical protein
VSSRRMENTFMLSVTKVILNIYFMSLWQPIIFPLTVDKIYYYLYQREIHKVFFSLFIKKCIISFFSYTPSSSYYPLINPRVNPAYILPVRGIPKLVIANKAVAAAW